MARGQNKLTILGQHVIGQEHGLWDFLYDASTVKDTKYNLGDRVVLPDGRVFRYGKCGLSVSNQKLAVQNYNVMVAPKATLLDAAVAGSRSLTLTVAASTYGVARGGEIALDELRGGYISIYNSTTERENRGIVGNTALTATGIAFTIYLDAPIKVAIASASTYCEILGNPYADLRQENYEGGVVYGRVMGMPTTKATTGQYFWIQTWGICRVSPCKATFTALAYNGCQCVFGYNGGVLLWREAVNDSINPDNSYQLAGYIVESGRLGDTPGPFINLQINP